MVRRSTHRPGKATLQLPNYEILEVIGAGGMATVYKAVQKSLNRVVAIKELKPTPGVESTAVKRFEREAITSSAMSHENVVSIYDYFEIEGRRYLVMEYVGGTDLATIMHECGALPVAIASMIVLQVLRALEYIHASSLVHRDIKPGNIMVAHNGIVKLMDFGVVLTPDWETLTMPGTFVGTPRYMSPEQIKGSVVDFRSDLFSVGIIFYEMVTGKQLFDAPDKTQVFQSITRAAIKNPTRLRAGLPRIVSRSIRRCLKREARKRFETTQEMRRILEQFLGNHNMLTMRQQLVHFMREHSLLSERDTDVGFEPPQVHARQRLANFFLDNLVGAERYGLASAMLWGALAAVLLSLVIWWQDRMPASATMHKQAAGLKVVATPWAKVYVDGKFREVTPFEQAVAVGEGYHKVVLKHDEYGSRTYELLFRRGEVTTLAIDFRGFAGANGP
jgi:serine/threonine protein kinase